MLDVVFMGSPEFAVPSLRAVHARHRIVAVVTQPDKPAGRGRSLTKPAVKVVAEELGLPVLQPASAKKPEFAEAMRQTGAALGVVVAYGKILPLSVLTAFPKGCVNVHGSLLPKWRGAAPIQWSVLHGDDITGITIMQLDEGMDTGPMLCKAEEKISPNDTSGTLSERLSKLGAELLLPSLEDIERGTAKPVAQDSSQATLARMLNKADGQIQWNKSAQEISQQVRGLDPWPVATAELLGMQVKLWGAQVVAGSTALGEPGQILDVSAQGATVVCSQGAVIISEIGAPGKRRMSFLDFSRGHSLDGKRFS